MSENESENGRGKALLDVICSFDRALWTIFTMAVLMLVLASFAFVFLDRSSGAYVILKVDIAVLVVTLVAVVFVIRQCSHKY